MVGVPPFNAPNHYTLIRQLQYNEAKVPDDLAATLSQSCKALLQGLLKKNPLERMSFDEFFSHPFLRSPRRAAEPCPAPQAPSQPVSASSSMCSSHSVQLVLDSMTGTTPTADAGGPGLLGVAEAGHRERERPHGPSRVAVPMVNIDPQASGDSTPRQRSRDDPNMSARRPTATASAATSLRPMLVAMPGSRFAHLATSSCLPPLPHGVPTSIDSHQCSYGLQRCRGAFQSHANA